jgi:hypothetical protein
MQSKEERNVITKTIEHWERMREYAANQPSKKFLNMDMMEEDIGERPSGEDCPLCNNYTGGCITDCPLGKKYGDCTLSERNYYPKRIQRPTWGEWVEQADKFIIQLKSLIEKEEIDWSKPIRGIYSKERYEVITPLGFVRIKRQVEGKEFNVDRYGIGERSSYQEIENIPDEPEYIPIQTGDIIVLPEGRYILANLGNLHYCFISINDGNRLVEPVKVINHNISLEEFKKLLGNKAESWEDITIIRRYYEQK